MTTLISNNKDRASLLVPATLIVLTIALYLPVLESGFIWDDDSYILENQQLKSAAGLRNIWLSPLSVPQWYPLVFTVFWGAWHLWGDAAFGYHLLNVLAHTAAVVLLFLVLRRLKISQAWFAAALFAAHPVVVESVAWITELKNTLSTSLALGALLAYWKFVGMEGEGRRGAWRLYALAAALFLAALLSKTVVAVLPPAIGVILWWQGRLGWRQCKYLAPLLAIGVGFGIFTARIEQGHVGAEGVEWSFTIIERFFIAGRAICFYASKLIWPDNLNFIYPRWDLRVAGAWLYPGVAAAAVVALWTARKRLGRGPLAAALLFMGTLAPVLGFVNVYPMRFSFVADHFQYLACIPLLTMAAIAIGRITARRNHLKIILPAMIILALANVAISHQREFANTHRLWHIAAEKNPDSWMARNNHGDDLARGGFSSLAIQECSAAIELSAEVIEREGRTAAKRDILRSDRAQFFNYRGGVYCQLGNYAAGIEDYKSALEIKPRFASAHLGLGNAFSSLGDQEAAISEYMKSLEVEKSPAAYTGLGMSYAAVRRYEDALAAHSQAIALAADKGKGIYYFNRGMTYVAQNEWRKAIADFSKCAELSPEQTGAYDARARASYMIGDLKSAVEDFSRYLRIFPRQGQALQNRARCYLELKRYDLAWEDAHACDRVGFAVDPELRRMLVLESGRTE